MALAFSHLSWWLWSGKHQEPRTICTSAIGTSAESNLWDPDNQNQKFPSVKHSNAGSSSRRIRRKWQSREERRRIMDREYDVVLVPSDGGCVSGSESDDSDYSIGWLEPHGPGFNSDDDDMEDGAFAVLVRCYGHKSGDAHTILQNNVHGAIINFPETYPADGTKYIEQFLASLRSRKTQRA